jgi:hypothetical protein
MISSELRSFQWNVFSFLFGIRGVEFYWTLKTSHNILINLVVKINNQYNIWRTQINKFNIKQILTISYIYLLFYDKWNSSEVNECFTLVTFVVNSLFFLLLFSTVCNTQTEPLGYDIFRFLLVFIFDIYVTEYGTALTTILPILFLYLNTVTVTAGTFEP